MGKIQQSLKKLTVFLLVMVMCLTPFFAELPTMAADSVDCQAILDTKDSLHLTAVASDDDSAIQQIEIEEEEILVLTISPQTAAQPLGWEVTDVQISDTSILEVLDELPQDAKVDQEIKSELVRKDALFIILRGKQTGSVRIDVQLGNPAWEQADAEHYQPVNLNCESVTVPRGTKAARAANAVQYSFSNGSELQSPPDNVDNDSTGGIVDNETDQNQSIINQPTVSNGGDNGSLGNIDNNSQGAGNNGTTDNQTPSEPDTNEPSTPSEPSGEPDDDNQSQEPGNQTPEDPGGDDDQNTPGGADPDIPDKPSNPDNSGDNTEPDEPNQPGDGQDPTIPDNPDQPDPEQPVCDFCGSTEHTTAEHPFCEVCGSPDHVADAHCASCGALGHQAEDHCSFCDALGHSIDDHTCAICDGIYHFAEDHCSECGALGHQATDHCSECGSIDHTADDHCSVCHDLGHAADAHCAICASMEHATGEHCSSCGALGHQAADHCGECGDLGHAASAHCPICKTIEHQLHPIDLSSLKLAESNFVYNGEAPELEITGAPEGIDLKFNVVSSPEVNAGNHQYVVEVEVPEGYAPVGELTFDYTIEKSPIKIMEQHNKVEQDGQTIDQINVVTEGVVTSDIAAVDQTVTDARGNMIDNFNLNTAAPGSYQVLQSVKIKDDKLDNYIIETDDALEDTGVYNIKSNHAWFDLYIELEIVVNEIVNDQVIVKLYANNNRTSFATQPVKAEINFYYVCDSTQLQFVEARGGGQGATFAKDGNGNFVEASTIKSPNYPVRPIGENFYLGALVFDILDDAKDIVFTVNNIRLTPAIDGSTLPYTYTTADVTTVINPDKIEQHDIVVEHNPADDVIYKGNAEDKAEADAALNEYIGETWADLKPKPDQPLPDIGEGEVDPWADSDVLELNANSEAPSPVIEEPLAPQPTDVVIVEETPVITENPNIENVENTENVENVGVIPTEDVISDSLVDVVVAETLDTEDSSELNSEQPIISTENVDMTPTVIEDDTSSVSESISAPDPTPTPTSTSTDVSTTPEAPAAPVSYEAPAAA